MKSIRKLSLIMFLGTAVALVLEVLPFGAVLNFASPDGGTVRKTFSYFSLIPYGYANIGPFITALLSCAILVVCAVSAISGKRSFLKAISVLSFLSVITSLLPLFFGISYFSVTALFISLILICVFILSVIFQKLSK